MTDNEAVIREALWIARDLSIDKHGKVPEAVTQAPAALSDLITERDHLETERNDFQRLYLIWKDKHDVLADFIDRVVNLGAPDFINEGRALLSASPPEQEVS